jgi:hypothetical protein
VRELERERVTVQEAARQLGITESAVRKRAQRGQLRSEKAMEGKKERLYIFLDPDEDKFPEPFRERYIRSLEQRVNTLEDEVYRQQAILLNMTEAMKALSPPAQEESSEARESPQTVEEEPERAEPSSSTQSAQGPVPQRRSAARGAESETPHVVASSASHSRLGMSARVLVLGAIVTFLVTAALGSYSTRTIAIYLPWVGSLITLMLFGLCAGYTKRPSLSWFSWPHRWLRRSGRSVLEITVFVAGIPATAGLLIGAYSAPGYGVKEFSEGFSQLPLLFLLIIGIIVAGASQVFMSGAFLGNALRRLGVLGTPKEPLPDQEDADTEQEEVWSPGQEARWGLIGTLASAVLTGIFSVVVALID